MFGVVSEAMIKESPELLGYKITLKRVVREKYRGFSSKKSYAPPSTAYHMIVDWFDGHKYEKRYLATRWGYEPREFVTLTSVEKWLEKMNILVSVAELQIEEREFLRLGS